MPDLPFTLIGYAFFMVAAIATLSSSIATIHWLELEIGGTSVNFGLFKVCVGPNNECKKYADVSQYGMTEVNVVQGLCITAALLYAFTLLIIAHLVFGQKMLVQSKNHGHSCLVIGVLAAILAWSGVGKFTSMTDDVNNLNVDWNYGYSMYLASVSGVLSVMAGVFAIIAVNHLFNTQRSPVIVFPGGVQQSAPGVNIVTPGVSYGYPVNTQYPNPNMGTTMGTQPGTHMGPQPTVMMGPNQGYPQKPPSYY